MYKLALYCGFIIIFIATFFATRVSAQCQVVPTNTGSLSFSATLPQTGNYFIYSRIKVPSSTNNSLWIVVDGQCPGNMGTSNVNNWQWVPFGVQINQLNTNIKIVSKQDGIAVDRVLVIPAGTNGQASCIPVDKGDNCVATTGQFCANKRIGDADCVSDSQGKPVTSFDYVIWYSEFIAGCSSTNLQACGGDLDHDGNAMDANFNYPGTQYITTDELVNVFDYAVWIQGFLAGSANPTPTGIPATPTATNTPMAVNTNTPTPTAASNAQYPSQVLNLTNWKITIPFDGSDSGTDADEIKQPALATYTNPNYFFVSPAKNSVIFRAHAGGATTSGSGYPRSELRERTSNGTADASWSAGTGRHIMYIDQRVNHLPVAKPHIVVGQIHGGSDDLTVFRLEGTKLFIDINGSPGPTLTNNYQLGTRFNVKFDVQNNQVKYYYNGNLVPFTLNTNVGTAYFKAGAYTQSSCQGTKQVPGESCDAYGEVEIFDVQVTHN